MLYLITAVIPYMCIYLITAVIPYNGAYNRGYILICGYIPYNRGYIPYNRVLYTL